MLLTPHTAVGIVIGSKTKNPILAVFLAFISHFIVDRIPHWDFFTNTKKTDRLNGFRIYGILIDFGLSLMIGIFFTLYAVWVEKDTGKGLTIFASAAAANLPDAISSLKIFLGNDSKLIRFMCSFQSRNQGHAGFFWGISVQILILLASYFLLLN